MERLLFYDKIPDMECLAGDTLPSFTVAVETEDGDLTGCSMQLILASWDSKGEAVLCKECDPLPDGSGFTVTLDSADTAGLAGIFAMHFCMTDNSKRHFRKLAGVLTVRQAAQGGQL